MAPRKLRQGSQDRLGVQRVSITEDSQQVGEQAGAERSIGVVLRGERESGLAGTGGPVAAREVGNSYQRLPGIGGAVLHGHQRLSVAQPAEMSADPRGQPRA